MKFPFLLAAIGASIVGVNTLHARYIGANDARAITNVHVRADQPDVALNSSAGMIAQSVGNDIVGGRRTASDSSDMSGISGLAAPQGHVGLAGTYGPTGSFNNWTPYQRFAFDKDSADVRFSDMRQASDITAYMLENPTARLGIDGSSSAPTAEWRDQALTERRIGAVRDALVQAGTPAFKIQIGAFGDPESRRENQVEVLLITVR
ncbi:OmpA family protein [Ferrovibrio sp. MS7]|uniref:OmpA family protein n=1 Tax=Ferrovibrio plantarum TaxID=3119164 RepID=UPI0031358ED4